MDLMAWKLTFIQFCKGGTFGAKWKSFGAYLRWLLESTTMENSYLSLQRSDEINEDVLESWRSAPKLWLLGQSSILIVF